MLRFDLSELKDYRGFLQLVGDPDQKGAPARLIDPVRAQPFQVVLFDELEKAHPNVWDLLLSILDAGRLTTPQGETVDFRNTIIICTSNAGASDAGREVGFGARDHGGVAADRIRKGLEESFRPEFLNRFQYIVPFRALGQDQLRTVARIERLLYVAEYKRRQAPPGVKLGKRNFGRDRRYPITNAFRTD